MLKKLIKDQRGATLIEYVGLAVLILAGIWYAATNLAGGIGDRMEDLEDRIAP